MTLSFKDFMYHFNDEEKSNLFIRKLLSPFFTQPVQLLPKDRMLMLGRSGSEDVTVCTVMKHPQNTLSYVLGGAHNPHSSTLCKVNTLSHVLGGVGNPHFTTCCKV